MPAIRRPLALAAGLTLLAAAPAGAKGIFKAEACGAGGCVDVTDRVPMVEAAMEAGPTVLPPSDAAPFYRLRMHADHGPRGGPMTLTWVPSVGRLAIDSGRRGALWTRPPARARTALARMTAGIEPVPGEQLARGRRHARRGRAPARDEGGTPAPAAAIGAVALLLAGGGLAVARRRRSRPR